MAPHVTPPCTGEVLPSLFQLWAAFLTIPYVKGTSTPPHWHSMQMLLTYVRSKMPPAQKDLHILFPRGSNSVTKQASLCWTENLPHVLQTRYFLSGVFHTTGVSPALHDSIKEISVPRQWHHIITGGVICPSSSDTDDEGHMTLDLGATQAARLHRLCRGNRLDTV